MKHLQFSDGTQFSLASGGGWSDVCAWVEGLPKHYYALKEFARTGACEDTLQLHNELGEALDTEQVLDADVEDVLERLYSTLGVGDSDETATVVM